MLVLVAGAVLPVQGAINAELRAELHNAFAVATAAIAVLLLLLLALRRTPRPRPRSLNTVSWWGWLGGAAAAVDHYGLFRLPQRSITTAAHPRG